MPAIKPMFVNAIPATLVKIFAAPYVAGDSMEKALAVADNLYRQRGIETTMDVLGEAEKDKEHVRKAVELYIQTASALKDRPYCTISVKPGHFGYYIDPAFCRKNLEELAAVCQANGTGMTIDMEDTDLTDYTLATYREMKPKCSVLGTVIQTRLHRTEKDLGIFDGLNAHIRVCIGIYRVQEPLATQNKREMKERLLRVVKKLAESGHYVCVATHDIEYVRKARQILTDMKVPKDRYEFQMLLGVPRENLQKELVEAGEKVRLYVPFAVHWDDAIAYLRRRMIENPFMAGLVIKNLLHRSG